MLRRISTIGAIVFSIIAASAAVALAGAGPATQRLVSLSGNVLPQLRSARDLGRLPAGRQLVVAVVVHHNLSSLFRAEAALYDATSPSYRHFLTPAQFRARFGAPAGELASIRRFLTSAGLTLFKPGLLGDYVEASGSVAQVERTFGVQLDRFRTASGRTFYANRTAAHVPAGLGIANVLGLESFDSFQLAGRMKTAAAKPDQTGCIASQACVGAVSPQDLWSAYDMPSDNLGQGQTIAVIGEGQTQDVIQALREFEKTRNLPGAPVQVVHTDPAAAGAQEATLDDSGRIEWEMDTQSSTGMAPAVDQLRMYFGSSLLLTQITGALSYWANDPRGPLQASASLGACEDNPALHPLLGADEQQMSAVLAQAAMEGRTLFASAGDTGFGCSLAVSENGVQYGPIPTQEFPAIDPNAVSVGGTTLDLTPGSNPKIASERAWDHTGGGPSKFVPQPAYQTGASPLLESNACATDSAGNPYPPGQLCRGAVDVSALSGDGTIVVNHKIGDIQGAPGNIPANGIDMVDYCPSTDSAGTIAGPVAASPNCAYGASPGTMTDHFAEGGTSLSSPLWLGIWARIQAHHDAVDPATLALSDPAQSLGFANAVIYPLAEKQSATRPDFNDVTLGGNPYPAAPGWDFPTGWGSPDVSHLAADASGNSTTAAVAGPIGNQLPSPSQVQDPAPIQATPPAAPSCSYLFYDPSSDAPDGFSGSQDDNLDIVEGNFGLTPDGKDLRVVLSLKDLSTQIPSPSNYLDYEVYWNYAPAGGSTTTYAVDVQVDSSGNITYADGTEQITGTGSATNYQFVPNSSSAATGSFGSGPNGAIEVDVPLADIGSPKAGDVLSAASAYTADGLSSPSSPIGATGYGTISDQDGPAAGYHLGQTTCIDSGPAVSQPASSQNGGSSGGSSTTTYGSAQGKVVAPPPARKPAPAQNVKHKHKRKHKKHHGRRRRRHGHRHGHGHGHRHKHKRPAAKKKAAGRRRG